LETIQINRAEVRNRLNILNQHRIVTCAQIIELGRSDQYISDELIDKIQLLLQFEAQYEEIPDQLNQLLHFFTSLRIDACATNQETNKATALLLASHIAYLVARPNWCLGRKELHELSQLPLNQKLTELIINYLLTTPQYFRKSDDPERHFNYTTILLEMAIECITSGADTSPFWTKFQEFFSKISNFIPIYFSRQNPKEIMQNRAKLLKYHYGLSTNDLQQFSDLGNSHTFEKSRLKIGVINSHFSDQTETYSTIPVFEYLGTDFEVTLLAFHEMNSSIEKYAKSRAHSFHLLPPSIDDAVAFIRNLGLDLIWFGTNLTAVPNPISSLALQRLAPLQVTSVSSCVTTGIETIDAFISCESLEPVHRDNHYTERVILLPGMAHCQAYSPASSYPSEFEQGSLTFKDQTLRTILSTTPRFVSGANFYKLTPETRQAWYQILAICEESTLTLYPFNPNWSSRYRYEEFAELMWREAEEHKVEEARIIFKKSAPTKRAVYDLLSKSNVYLDSFPFSGINSLLDPLFCGLPVVCLKGDSFRSNLATSVLVELDCCNTLANTTDQYIKIASRLAKDMPYRVACHHLINGSITPTSRILDRKRFSAEISRVLKSIISSQRANVISSMSTLDTEDNTEYR
jgi:predicted O-linked N-acetylglucosamine transferase (SPINDLY family)